MKSTNIIIAIVVLILIAGGVYTFSNQNISDAMMEKDETMMKDDVIQSDKMMMEKEAMMQKDVIMKDEAMMSSSSDTVMKKETMMIKGASYEAYAPEKLANAEAGNVVLFFRAGWCPSCRTVDADIKANLKNIPTNLTILDVDYDKSSDLKKKYGVTTQHTFAQVDAKGNLIKKWTGGSTLTSVVGQVK